MNEQPQSTDVRVFPDAGSLAHAAADTFAGLARAAVQERGSFRVALSGGSTPRALYAALAAPEFVAATPWNLTQVFFSDERFVPPESEESNFHTAQVGLLSRVPIPDRFVHRVPTVDIPAEQAAAIYEQGIRRVFEAGLEDLPRFDLVLLGMGPDGHTASLFPDTAALTVRDRLVAANHVPKLDSVRITFTYPLINAARVVAFLVTGADKSGPLERVLAGDGAFPAAGARPTDGHAIWFVDEAAAQDLRRTAP